jgi:hypothetical protein
MMMMMMMMMMMNRMMMRMRRMIMTMMMMMIIPVLCCSAAGMTRAMDTGDVHIAVVDFKAQQVRKRFFSFLPFPAIAVAVSTMR